MEATAHVHHDYGWRAQYGWLDTFWRDVLGPRPGRRWMEVTLFDRDTDLRDAVAFFSVLARLMQHNSDVARRFVRAWAAETAPPLPPEYDLVVLGRVKPYANACFAGFASWLEGNMVGKFLDKSDGSTSNVICYAKRQFARQLIEVSPEEPRRCLVDYGLLIFRTDERTGRRVCAIAGLGRLGTHGTALILTDDARRAELLQQVRELAPWHERLRPSEAFEVCVRVSVGGPDRLADILNDPSPLRFRVVAVAVAGGELAVREAVETEVELLPGPDGEGIVRLEGVGEARLTARRFRLARRIVEQPEQSGIEKLCEWLPSSKENLRKLVCDINKSIRRQIPNLPPRARLFHCDRTKRRYVVAATG